MPTEHSDSGLAAPLRRYTPSPNRDPDAGLRALSHYERRLPIWRYKLRQWLIPVVRWETPYLAFMQRVCRSALLDTYFAFAANLGTHTFFMMFLPVCFWCGYPELGVALVHMLGLGVYFTGVLKDLICLPRPLSPPLQRITMSGSAALEYGFPSTHTANAVSIALYGLNYLTMSRDEWSASSYDLLRLGCYVYATTIMLGRMYCGMHGLFDVVIGILIGAFLAWARIVYGNLLDVWILSGGYLRPALVVAVLSLAVKFHPEPADNCPCFDDSVAFLGVIMGVEVGTWHRAWAGDAEGKYKPSLQLMYPFNFDDLPKAALRLIIGIVVVFAWRAVMKPLLLQGLPPIFRFVDHWGFRLPRRYFLQSREYTKVPPLRKDDSVIPSASDIPSLLSSFSNPRRRRVSVGPQSEADAREFLASREQRRNNPETLTTRNERLRGVAATVPEEQTAVQNEASTANSSTPDTTVDTVTARARNTSLLTPSAQQPELPADGGPGAEEADQDMFSALLKPRTRYDVEVITKLVVYAGIAWLAVHGNPMLFERLGLA